MALPNGADLRKLDFTWLGKPFIRLPSKKTISTASYDSSWLGQPFVTIEAPSTTLGANMLSATSTAESFDNGSTIAAAMTAAIAVTAQFAAPAVVTEATLTDTITVTTTGVGGDRPQLNDLNYVRLGRPFVRLPSKKLITTKSYDYVWLGQPFATQNAPSAVAQGAATIQISSAASFSSGGVRAGQASISATVAEQFVGPAVVVGADAVDASTFSLSFYSFLGVQANSYDFTWLGQPFVKLPVSALIATKSYDYTWLGEPFVAGKFPGATASSTLTDTVSATASFSVLREAWTSFNEAITVSPVFAGPPVTIASDAYSNIALSTTFDRGATMPTEFALQSQVSGSFDGSFTFSLAKMITGRELLNMSAAFWAEPFVQVVAVYTMSNTWGLEYGHFGEITTGLLYYPNVDTWVGAGFAIDPDAVPTITQPLYASGAISLFGYSLVSPILSTLSELSVVTTADTYSTQFSSTDAAYDVAVEPDVETIELLTSNAAATLSVPLAEAQYEVTDLLRSRATITISPRGDVATSMSNIAQSASAYAFYPYLEQHYIQTDGSPDYMWAPSGAGGVSTGTGKYTMFVKLLQFDNRNTDYWRFMHLYDNIIATGERHVTDYIVQHVTYYDRIIFGGNTTQNTTNYQWQMASPTAAKEQGIQVLSISVDLNANNTRSRISANGLTLLEASVNTVQDRTPLHVAINALMRNLGGTHTPLGQYARFKFIAAGMVAGTVTASELASYSVTGDARRVWPSTLRSYWTASSMYDPASPKLKNLGSYSMPMYLNSLGFEQRYLLPQAPPFSAYTTQVQSTDISDVDAQIYSSSELSLADATNTVTEIDVAAPQLSVAVTHLAHAIYDVPNAQTDSSVSENNFTTSQEPLDAGVEVVARQADLTATAALLPVTVGLHSRLRYDVTATYRLTIAANTYVRAFMYGLRVQFLPQDAFGTVLLSDQRRLETATAGSHNLILHRVIDRLKLAPVKTLGVILAGRQRP